jgi:integrase
MRLTQRRIEDLRCPAGRKDRLVFDDEQRGLGVRVTAAGGKTFLAQYTVGSRKRRIPLGSTAAISLADARRAVQDILGEVARGRDPASDRMSAALKAKQEVLALASLIDQWSDRHLVHRRPRYAAEAVRALRHAFGRHLASPATALTPKAARAILNAIADNGRRSIARLTGAYGRACFAWALQADLVAENPFTGIRLEAAPSRERVLPDRELIAIWEATAAGGPYDGIVRLLMLTGQRREEVAGMLWSELDRELTGWTIPEARSKNHRAHVVPLSKQARAVLTGQLRIKNDDRVFGGFRGFAHAKLILDNVSGVKGWWLHDLRRTVATGLQKLGIRLEVTEAVLNHVSGSRAGIVGIYQRHNWSDEKRAALAAWGAHVEAIVEGREVGGDLVAFARGG